MFRLGFQAIYLALVIWVVVDVLGTNWSTNKKVIWILLVVFLPVMGSIIYLVKKNSKTL